MMLRCIVATLLVEYVSSASLPKNNLTEEELIASIFNPCTEGECFLYYQCENGTAITTGKGMINLRFGDQEDSGTENGRDCKGLFDTCCTTKLEKPKIPDNQPYNGCGHRNVNGVGFQITGARNNESQFGEFPWSVGIYKDDSFQCGGSPSVVLTVAHCVSGKIPKSLKIRAGEWDTQTNDEIFPHQDRYISEIIIHEKFDKDTASNDIALLFLDKPVEIAAHVNTVCLPPPDYVFDGSKCFATGWGKDVFGKSGKLQVILKRKELPIVPRESCQNALRKTRLGRVFELHESFICAGGELGIDMCEGDGGSPLVCPVPGKVDRYYQAGIVAWGIGCGDPIPGVYVDVALFRNWIDAKVLEKQHDKTSYLIESKNIDFRSLKS